MNVSDFHIGLHFTNATGIDYKCTDVGTRTILAIAIDPDRDSAWYMGPPYAVPELVFDEKNMAGCFTSLSDALCARASDNYHPGFPGHIAKRMFSAKRGQTKEYPNKPLLRYDRVNPLGKIAHPYAAQRVNDEWMIEVYFVYTEEFDVVSENEFVRWPVAIERDYKFSHTKRANPV